MPTPNEVLDLKVAAVKDAEAVADLAKADDTDAQAKLAAAQGVAETATMAKNTATAALGVAIDDLVAFAITLK